MDNSFPIYRKLEGFNRFYKIESPDLFIEVAFSQGEAKYQKIQAVQFPEKLRIQDMISCAFHYVPMNEEEIFRFFQ